jgi:hypothetical protein
VSSFILVGLGETPESVIGGSDSLADMGVYPFVVPLRPIPGSPMADALPPDHEIMGSIYREVARILARKGLSYTQSLAGCVRCGACSALPAHERPFEKLICHPSRTEEERKRPFPFERGFLFWNKSFSNRRTGTQTIKMPSIWWSNTKAGSSERFVSTLPKPETETGSAEDSPSKGLSRLGSWGTTGQGGGGNVKKKDAITLPPTFRKKMCHFLNNWVGNPSVLQGLLRTASPVDGSGSRIIITPIGRKNH